MSEQVRETLQRRLPPILTTQQAGAATHLDRVNIRLAMHKGSLPGHRLPGGRTRLYILRHELIDWIMERGT